MKETIKTRPLKFKFTKDMQKTLRNILYVNQLLEINKSSYKHKIYLEREKEKLLEHFKYEFQKHNIKEIKQYKEEIKNNLYNNEYK